MKLLFCAKISAKKELVLMGRKTWLQCGLKSLCFAERSVKMSVIPLRIMIELYFNFKNSGYLNKDDKNSLSDLERKCLWAESHGTPDNFKYGFRPAIKSQKMFMVVA